MVDTTCQLIEACTPAPKVLFERWHIHAVDISHGLDADPFHVRFRDFADTRDSSDRQRDQECLYLMWLNASAERVVPSYAFATLMLRTLANILSQSS